MSVLFKPSSVRPLAGLMSRGMAREIRRPEYEPHTFMTQPRHPVHHFINLVKFSTLGACIFYTGSTIIEKITDYNKEK